MSRARYLTGGIATILVGLIAYSSLFQVSETQQAIILQFGDPRRVISEPGLNYKHFWQSVRFYEKRVLNLDPPVETMVLFDQKRVMVDSFLRYRIVDPLEFFRTVRDEETLDTRLSTISNSVIREVLGKTTLPDILSEQRKILLNKIVANLDAQAKRFGVDIVDARIRRADLPEEISERVYARMQSEREREAKEFRAQGEQRALEIRALADRQVTVIKAEAKRQADTLRGVGEARRANTLNAAHAQDPEFFAFYRSMQAYTAALAGEDTLYVLSTQSAFFDYFNHVNPQHSGRVVDPGPRDRTQ